MAEQEMATKATTAKTIQIDFIHHDCEVRGIAQRYATIREGNVAGASPDTTKRK